MPPDEYNDIIIHDLTAKKRPCTITRTVSYQYLLEICDSEGIPATKGNYSGKNAALLTTRINT